ncbi:nuclear transport factor 2 family protein [Chloroflexota bacterium]
MMLTKKEIVDLLNQWNKAWNEHDIDKVAKLFHDDIIFENWTGAKIRGAKALKKAWEPWFRNHMGFRFNTEDLFVDEEAQKILFQWSLDWPSVDKKYHGKPEHRRGVDVMHFEDGKIKSKYTYSKTTIEIEGKLIKYVSE